MYNKYVELVESVITEEDDTHAMNEIILFIENDGDLYRQMITPLIKNYARKLAKGKLDQTLAVKGFVNLVKTGITKYKKSHGHLPQFSAAAKTKMAAKLLSNYQEEIQDQAKELGAK